MKRRALIVDDEPEDAELIRDILKTKDMHALVLSRSAAAAAAASSSSSYLWTEEFSLAFLNFQMVAPDGLELARRIRTTGINRKTPIAMLTDDEDPAALSEGFEAGADFVRYKPIDTASLLRLIQVTHGIAEDDRRRFRRVPLRSKVQLTCADLDVEAETIDVSLNGLLVKSDRVVPAGSRAHMSLHLSPGALPIVGSCSIVRVVGKNQMGIQFDRLPLAESQRLEQFIVPMARHEWPQAAFRD